MLDYRSVINEIAINPKKVEIHISGQISIIPKPELRGFWGSSLIKPPFRVTSADVVIICPDIYIQKLKHANFHKNSSRDLKDC